jgi:hypothetical protein
MSVILRKPILLDETWLGWKQLASAMASPGSPSNLAQKGWVAIEARFDAVRFFPAFPFLSPGCLQHLILLSLFYLV